MGFNPARVVTYKRGEGFLETIGTQTQKIAPSCSNPLHEIGKHINLKQPHFFLISPDLIRNQSDDNLPLLIFIQPGKEAFLSNGKITDSQGLDEINLDALCNKVENATEKPISAHNTAYSHVGWSTESDDDFIRRLNLATAQLQNIEEKMIVMRGFQKSINANLDTAELYRIYSLLEPECAAGHLAYLANNYVSLGRSPENVFEIVGDKLYFDVMASTRGISNNLKKDASLLHELITDPKEQREHDIAIQRFKRNMLKVCEESSVQFEKKMSVSNFRHVRHLHSRLSATIKDNCSYLDIIQNSFPPLQSYTKELVQLSDTIKEPLRYYGGMVGYLNRDRSEVSCFLNIRSLLRHENTLFTHGGVGVMKESIAKNECLEVKNKLRCLMEAVRVWENC